MFYQNIFEYMNMSINGVNSLKMIMIKGQDIAVGKYMKFLDGTKIIPRIEYPNLEYFCDSVYTSYSEYIYDNDTNNKISKCGIKNAKKVYYFCYNWYNTFR